MHVAALKIFLLNHRQMLCRNAAVTVNSVTYTTQSRNELVIHHARGSGGVHGGLNSGQLLQALHQVEQIITSKLQLVPANQLMEAASYNIKIQMMQHRK
jgi:hypothetical protein